MNFLFLSSDDKIFDFKNDARLEFEFTLILLTDKVGKKFRSGLNGTKNGIN